MADNTVLNAGSGGDTMASDDIGGIKFQRVKLIHGADGVNAGDVATGNPLPVVQTGSLPAGTNNIGEFTRNIDDTTRVARSFMLDAYTAAPVAEALQTVVQWFNNAAVGGTTQPAVVTAGKRLRLTTWSMSTKSLNTVGSAVMRIRANTGGLVVIGSPLVWSAEVGSRAGATTVAMTGGLDQQTGCFPEGFEFPAGTGLGFTLAGYGPTGTLTLQGVTRFQVYGYEYTP